MAALSKPLAQTAHPPRVRRGLPIAAMTLRENKIAIYSVIGCILMLLTLITMIGPDFKLNALQAMTSSNNLQAFFGFANMPRVEGFTLFLSIQMYGNFSGLIYGGAVAFFSGSTIARNIENGMIELALTRPISRARYYFERWLGIVMMIGIFSLVMLGGVGVAAQVVATPGLEWRWLLTAQLLAAALWFAFAGIGMLSSVVFSSGRSGGGAALGLVVVSFMLNMVGGSSDAIAFLADITPLKYAPLSNVLLFHELTWWHPALLVAIGVVSGLAGLVVFRRRDIAC